MKSKVRSRKESARNSSKARPTVKRKTRVATNGGVLEIENGLGRMKTARAIAKSLKKAADASDNLTTAPFHAAMAALDHLIGFLERQRVRLEAAKDELRRLYGETMEEPNRRVRRISDARGSAVRSDARRPRKRGSGIKTAAA